MTKPKGHSPNLKETMHTVRDILLLAIFALFATTSCVAPGGPQVGPAMQGTPGAQGGAGTGPGALFGVITGPDGTPTAGVVVRAYLNNASPLANIDPLTSVSPLVGNSGGALVGNAGGALNGANPFRTLLAFADRRVAEQAPPQIEAVTDASGVFSFSNPATGTLNVEAVKSDRLKVFSAKVAVTRDKAVDLGTMQLQPTGTIVGRVTAPDALAVSNFLGVDVFVPGSSYGARADAAGTFTMTNVAAGTFDLVGYKIGLGAGLLTGISVRSKQTTTVPDLALVTTPPVISRVVPPAAGPGSQVTLEGSHFGASTGDPVMLSLAGAALSGARRPDDRTLIFTVPANARTGDILLTVGLVPSATASLTVLKAVAVNAFDSNMLPSTTTRFAAVALDQEGSLVSSPSVTWSSDDPAITVSSAGVVTANALGMATLKVSSGNLTGSIKVNVVDHFATVSTLAGGGDGSAFSGPQGLAWSTTGVLYVADTGNNSIRTVTSAGSVATLVGGSLGSADGTGTAAKFKGPTAIALEASGSLLVCDPGNSSVRRVSPAGVVTTYASGRPFGGVAADSSAVFLADNLLFAITRLAGSAGARLAGSDSTGMADGTGTAASFGYIGGLAIGPSGALYVADTGNNRIRKVSPGGVVTTIAGGAAGFSDGPGTVAQFSAPAQIAVDASESIYVADTRNNRIRKISPTGLVTTLAGGGDPDVDLGSFADGLGPDARFSHPSGIAVDPAGILYVADRKNNRVRKVVQ